MNKKADAQVPKPSSKTSDRKDIFISYSSLDNIFAQNLANALRKENITVWLDKWDIPFGADITSSIQEGLSNSSFMLVILSQNSMRSKWVEVEWTTKFGEEIQKREISVIPTILGSLQETEIPLLLRGKKRINLADNFNEEEFRQFIDFIISSRKRRFNEELNSGETGEMLKEGLVDILKNHGKPLLDMLLLKIEESSYLEPEKRIQYLKNEVNFHYNIASKNSERDKLDFENDPDGSNFQTFVMSGREFSRIKEIKERIYYIIDNNKDTIDTIEEIKFDIVCRLKMYDK